MKRYEAGGEVFKEDACPDCHGSRLNEQARAPKLQGITLDKACEMTLSQLITWWTMFPVLSQRKWCQWQKASATPSRQLQNGLWSLDLAISP